MIASMTRESAAIASFPPSSNATKSLREMFDSSPVKMHSQVDWELPAAVQEVRKLLRTSAGYAVFTVSDVEPPHAASATVSSAEKIARVNMLSLLCLMVYGLQLEGFATQRARFCTALGAPIKLADGD